MSFSDVIWFIVVSFGFIFYLMVLFSIVGDLFADHETRGAAKALWGGLVVDLPVTDGAGVSDRSWRRYGATFAAFGRAGAATTGGLPPQHRWAYLTGRTHRFGQAATGLGHDHAGRVRHPQVQGVQLSAVDAARVPATRVASGWSAEVCSCAFAALAGPGRDNGDRLVGVWRRGERQLTQP
jgi:hypothetical protein